MSLCNLECNTIILENCTKMAGYQYLANKVTKLVSYNQAVKVKNLIPPTHWHIHWLTHWLTLGEQSTGSWPTGGQCIGHCLSYNVQDVPVVCQWLIWALAIYCNAGGCCVGNVSANVSIVCWSMYWSTHWWGQILYLTNQAILQKIEQSQGAG